MDSLYTTVEILINKIKNNLTKANTFAQGDAVTKHHTGVDDKVNNEGTSGGETKSSTNPALRWYGTNSSLKR